MSWDSKRHPGATSAVTLRRFPGLKRRRWRCCPTTRRWYISSAIARASRPSATSLLHGLRDAGDLGPLDLDLALAEPLTTEPHDLPDLAPHLLDTLRARDPARHRVRTTLDARLQAQATQLVDEHSATLARQYVNNAAALIVDNRTFEVLAYVGNTRNGDDLGHAVDIVRRPRSTGSILKPMLYAAMLDDGLLTPRMMLPDVPTHYEGFSPENFDRQYRGAVRADEALAQSLNIPAVRELKTYGVARFADLLRVSGMSTLTRPADAYGLTLILGGAEGNLWDITGLYASLAGISRAGLADAAPRFHVLSAVVNEPAAARAPTPISTGAALAHDARASGSAASRRGRPLAQLRRQPRHRVEDRHQLGSARWLGRGQHQPLHGRRVGGQCQRRRPAWVDRLDHGRAVDVRPVQRAARERLVRAARARAAPGRGLCQRWFSRGGRL